MNTQDATTRATIEEDVDAIVYGGDLSLDERRKALEALARKRNAVRNPKFGDLMRNPWASESNPQRDGYFVRSTRRTGRMNPGLWYEMTNRNGKFWEVDGSVQLFIDTPAPDMRSTEGLTEFKTDDIVRRGYKKVGYVLENDEGAYCLSAQSAVRWLEKAQYWRLMHEQDGSLFAAPAAPAPAEPDTIRDALELGLDLARAHAAREHERYKGYKPHVHAAVDADVRTMEDALAALDARGAAQDSIARASDEPIAWLEAEQSARGGDPRYIFGKGSMLFSTRVSTVKPTSSNPCWPLYLHPAPDMSIPAPKIDTSGERVEGVKVDERAAFERHERASELTREADGDYANPCVQSAWEGWQARAAMPVAGPAQAATWEPKFEAIAHEQEQLAIKFSHEIAGERGGMPSLPDPVRLLEMAEALYLAERNDPVIGIGAPVGEAQS